ncbi:MAG: hypothetical protein IJS52_05895 [Bacilli bacterium]|nr:hypothetical protein [Bacilli bacterium]
MRNKAAEQPLLILFNHPISVFRVNGVINQFEKFYETYAITANDKMYVAPADRLNIWG